MDNVKVVLSGKKSFNVSVRGHKMITDLPVDQGGDDTGPTTVELFVSSIGACMGIYALSYLKTAGVSHEGLSLSIDWTLGKNKSRIREIKATLSLAGADLGDRRSALLSAAKKCLLYNTVYEPPEISLELSED